MSGLRVVALDVATRTGLAHTHDSTGQACLAVRTVAADLLPLHAKVDAIEMDIRKACGAPTGRIRDRAKAPDLVIVEGTFSRPGAADYQLHAMRAVPLQWLYRNGIPYVEVAPSTLKAYATGSGSTRGENKVGKDKVRAAVVATYGRLLNIDPRDDNQCDAVVLLAMCLDAYGQPLAPVPQTHRRALAAVTWPSLAAVAA